MLFLWCLQALSLSSGCPQRESEDSFCIFTTRDELRAACVLRCRRGPKALEEKGNLSLFLSQPPFWSVPLPWGLFPWTLGSCSAQHSDLRALKGAPTYHLFQSVLGFHHPRARGGKTLSSQRVLQHLPDYVSERSRRCLALKGPTFAARLIFAERSQGQV